LQTPTILREREIRAALRMGGTIRGAFLVARKDSPGYEFLPYIHPSWSKLYLPLRTYDNKADKTYRDVGRFIQVLREIFCFAGPVCIHDAKAPELSRFKGLRPEDSPPGGRSLHSTAPSDSSEEAEE